MNVLVTGGAGFIGSHLVDALVGEGHRVRVLDNFSTGRRENLRGVLDQIELLEGDLRDLDAVRPAVDGVQWVFHQGAIPSVQQSVEQPMRTHEANARGTLNLLTAALDAGVQRVVYASSCALYGDDPELPKHEEMAPQPLSPYAASKLAGEAYCRAFSQVYGLETVVLRYFNVFGPRQDPAGEYAAVIPKFVTAMLEGRRPTIYGDGRQSRDFVYVADVVRANLLASQADGVSGEVINVACGLQRNLLELVDAINQILGTELRPIHTDPQPGDVRHSRADITKAGRLLKFEPQVGFDEALRLIIDWYR